MQNRRSRGMFLMTSGMALLLMAAMLTVYNVNEQNRGASAVSEVLGQLKQTLPKTAAAAETPAAILADVGEAAFPRPTRTPEAVSESALATASIREDVRPTREVKAVSGDSAPLIPETDVHGSTAAPVPENTHPAESTLPVPESTRPAESAIVPAIGTQMPPASPVPENTRLAETAAVPPVITAAAAPEPLFISNPDMEMPTQNIKGNDYIGILEIPSLDISLPVMEEWTYPKLRIAPCRYTGSVYTNDMIVSGHNYDRHFGGLNKLRPGDEVRFTDMDGHVFIYAVYETELLKKTDVKKMQSGNWDLTLFTCTIGGKNRVTVRCKFVTYG